MSPGQSAKHRANLWYGAGMAFLFKARAAAAPTRTLSRLAPALVLAAAVASGPMPASAQVEVAPLSAPDVFSGGSRDTGLGGDLWRGSSADLARAVMPTIGDKPLSPAGRRLAVRVLSTGANAPDGAGADLSLAAARARGLLALGDGRAAFTSVERIPNLAAEPALAEVAAEAALIAGADDQACRIEAMLTVGRGEIYWLRLRAYCQAIAGQADAAQLTMTLANEQARDPIFTRLMLALTLGADSGAASSRNGLDLAASRRLGLTPTTAGAPPAIAAALSSPQADAPPPPEMMETDPVRAARLYIRAGQPDQARIIRQALTQDEIPGARPADLNVLDALLAIADGQAPGSVLDALVQRGALNGARSPAQVSAVYLQALGAPMSPERRAEFASFDIGRFSVSPVRLAALDQAAEAGLKGETALIALGIAADAGPAGPAPPERAAIIRALRKVGLVEDARAFAIEGVLALYPR